MSAPLRTAVSLLSIACSTALADPVREASIEPRRVTEPRPRPDTTPAPVPVSDEPTAAAVAGSPGPGFESGRTDGALGDSTWRQFVRGTLFVPKLAVEATLFPFRTAVWADERYQLEDLYRRVFFNEARTIGLYPTATYESGFGFSAGAAFVHRDLFGEHEHLMLQATTGAIAGEPYRTGLFAVIGTGGRLGERFAIDLSGNFDRRPADPFYGIGNASTVEAPHGAPIDPRVDPTAVETYHRYQEARLAATATARVYADLRVLGTGSLTELAFSPSTTGIPIESVYDTADLVGFDHGVRHAYGELELRWDSRRRASRWEPTSDYTTGSLASVFGGRVERLDGGASYFRYGVELQHYFRIANGPRVIATRFRGEAVSGSIDEVPFTELPSLGGGLFLRGYQFMRFRDRVAALGSVEYQWDLSRFIDAYLFTDAGRVFPALDDLSVQQLRVGYGIGATLHSDAGFLIDVSLASSIDGGLFASASLNPVFDARPRWR